MADQQTQLFAQSTSTQRSSRRTVGHTLRIGHPTLLTPPLTDFFFNFSREQCRTMASPIKEVDIGVIRQLLGHTSSLDLDMEHTSE